MKCSYVRPLFLLVVPMCSYVFPLLLKKKKKKKIREIYVYRNIQEESEMGFS
jgi:hypothetical protein